MKKILQIGLILMLGFYATGCASTYNHIRVRENVCKEAIAIKGTQEQKDLVASGLSARKVIKFSPITKAGGDVDGFKFMIDAPLPNLNIVDAITGAVKSYIDTFKEAPVSSSVSLVTDIVAGIAIIEAVNDGGSGDDKTTSVDPATLPAGSIHIGGDNTAPLETVAGTVVVNGDNSGRVNTALPQEKEE